MKKVAIFFCLVLPFSILLKGQENPFPNSMFYEEAVGSPKADLSIMKWLAGRWEGASFGGVTEEVWTPPLGGSMMCAFKLVVNDEVSFYEILTISEEEGTIILRLKHFHQDLKGWEEKEETVDFRLVKVTKNKIFFDGFTFEKLSKKEMNIYVVIDSNGQKQEMKFNYKKQKK